jgi:MerR family transcriptional regulator, light-induced transcriptional regulator
MGHGRPDFDSCRRSGPFHGRMPSDPDMTKSVRNVQGSKPPADEIHPRQLAAAMGVSESSIKRWCDGGLLPCRKTAGGHRRLYLDGVVRFLRDHGHELVHPELVGLPARVTAGPAAVDRLFAQLQVGDAPAARDLVLGLVLGAPSMAGVFDDVVAPAFHRIGHAWERGELEVYREHRAVEISMRILHELRALLASPPAGAPRAIGATLEGDPYTLAITMVELVLREAGWRAECLGPSHPVATLRAAVADMKPSLVWLGVSFAPDPAGLLDQYAELHDAARAARAAVVVGGQALTGELRARMRYTAHGERIGDLLGLSESLLPGKRDRRRRGRARPR